MQPPFVYNEVWKKYFIFAGTMRKLILTACLTFLLLPSCKKNDDPEVSGNVTINNELTMDQDLQAYINYGFLFSKGKKVSNFDTPPPDIIVYRSGDIISFEANNLKNSFYKYGEYNDEASAKNAFDNLTSVNVTQWSGSASPLKANQIWLYVSGTERYAKIRIISTLMEMRGTFEFAECTFEWVFQPDGSATFPGK